MQEITANISWLSVVIGAVVAFLVGWLWYSERLFGKGWAEGSRVELGSANEMPMGAMAAQIIGLVLMSWFVAVTAANNALLTVILATTAFTVLAYGGNMFSRKNAYARNADAGYWVASLAIMIVVQGIF